MITEVFEKFVCFFVFWLTAAIITLVGILAAGLIVYLVLVVLYAIGGYYG